MKVEAIETLACDAGWRNYHFVKLSTEAGIVGWSEFDEGFGSPGVGAVIERLAPRVVGQPVGEHERIYAELHCATRPGSGGVVAQALGAIENALLDAKAKQLGVPCYALLGGKVRDRIRVYWSHCATWRINHPSYFKPAITDLDGVKAIGREVRLAARSLTRAPVFAVIVFVTLALAIAATTSVFAVLNATLAYQHDGKRILVYKGTAIRIGEKGEAAVIFDRNQLRWAAGWTGGYLKHSDRRFGLLNTPTPDGKMGHSTPSVLGCWLAEEWDGWKSSAT